VMASLTGKKMDKQIFIDGLKRYFKRIDKNLRIRIDYSRTFNMENEVSNIWRCFCNTQDMLLTLLGSAFYNERIPLGGTP
jgi:hypothetical protein